MKIVIIGNGIAGITAARWIRKHSDHSVTIISEETEFFFSRTALMYVFMGHMRFKDIKPYEDWFWKKNRLDLMKARVTSIDFKNKTLNLEQSAMTNKLSLNAQNSKLNYDKLIIATGSKSNKFDWQGQNLDGAHGLYSFQDLQAMERHAGNKITRAVIVGGGLIGIEMAEMFHARHIPVTILVREKSFWDSVLPPEESEMVNRVIRKNGIDLRLGVELESILDENNDGVVDAIITKNGERIACQFVGLAVGVSPNVDFLKNTELNINRGIVVNDYLETNIENVYAIGDCAEIQNPLATRKAIEAVWYTGRIMGETAATTICVEKTKYEPGIWFNSAKFLDIEYQVYGDIKTKPDEQIAQIYWEDKKTGARSIRIQYNKNSGAVLGFNLMGVRYRQEVCEKWIASETHIEDVLQKLSLANFDPEFYKQPEAELIAQYNAQNKKNIINTSQRDLNEVITFIRE